MTLRWRRCYCGRPSLFARVSPHVASPLVVWRDICARRSRRAARVWVGVASAAVHTLPLPLRVATRRRIPRRGAPLPVRTPPLVVRAVRAGGQPCWRPPTWVTMAVAVVAAAVAGPDGGGGGDATAASTATADLPLRPSLTNGTLHPWQVRRRPHSPTHRHAGPVLGGRDLPPRSPRQPFAVRPHRRYHDLWRRRPRPAPALTGRLWHAGRQFLAAPDCHRDAAMDGVPAYTCRDADGTAGASGGCAVVVATGGVCGRPGGDRGGGDGGVGAGAQALCRE